MVVSSAETSILCHDSMLCYTKVNFGYTVFHLYRRTGFNCIVLLHLSLCSCIANLMIASAQIARRGGLLIE